MKKSLKRGIRFMTFNFVKHNCPNQGYLFCNNDTTYKLYKKRNTIEFHVMFKHKNAMIAIAFYDAWADVKLSKIDELRHREPWGGIKSYDIFEKHIVNSLVNDFKHNEILYFNSLSYFGLEIDWMKVFEKIKNAVEEYKAIFPFNMENVLKKEGF